MKLSPFTLIYQSEPVARPEGPRLSSARRMATIRDEAPDLAKSLGTLPPKLRRTLLASSFALLASSFPQEKLRSETDAAAEILRPVLQDLERGDTIVTVALCDIDAHVGELPQIIDLLNYSQPVFTFFDLQAPIPSGLVIQSENFATWAAKRLDKHFSNKEQNEFENNLMFDDFNKYASRLYKAIGVDCMVGITKHMVAFEKEGELFWNYFTTSHNRVALASTYNVREYARRAGRPFEAAVGILVIARLLATLNPRIKYHPDRSCIFDAVPNREKVVEKIKAAKIEPDCLKLIDSKYRTAAEAMLRAIREYRGAEPAEQQKLSSMVEHDDQYWLKKLTELSKKLGKKSK